VTTLVDLTPADFELLVAAIPKAAQQVSHHGTVRQKVAELVRWAVSPTGCGLEAVEEALASLKSGPSWREQDAASLLAELRRDLVSARSPFELRKLLYKVRAYLAVHPYDADGEMLREQVENALEYHRRPAPPIAPPPVSRPILAKLLIIIIIICIILGYLFFLFQGSWRPRGPSRQVPPRDAQRPDGLGTNLLQGSSDLYDLLERTIREFSRITKTDYNQIFLINNKDFYQQLVCVADSIPAHKQGYRVAAIRGLLGDAYTSGRTINAPNVHDRPNYFEAVAETQSELIVPIKQDGRVIGFLNSESENIDNYTNDVAAESERLSSALAELLGKYGWSAAKPIDELPWVHYPRLNSTPDPLGKSPR
jgi:hypothetical protein